MAGGRRKEEKSRRRARHSSVRPERFALTRVTQSPAGLAPISRVSLEFVPRKKKRGEEQPDRVGETEGERDRRPRESRVEQSRRAISERVSACVASELRNEQRALVHHVCTPPIITPNVASFLFSSFYLFIFAIFI